MICTQSQWWYPGEWKYQGILPTGKCYICSFQAGLNMHINCMVKWPHVRCWPCPLLTTVAFSTTLFEVSTKLYVENTHHSTWTYSFPDKIFMLDDLKGEIQSRFNLFSEERVKYCRRKQWKLDEISWKITKLWHFEVSQIFKKHFLTSRYQYGNEWVDDVIASQFSIHFVHRNDKNLIFHLWEC